MDGIRGKPMGKNKRWVGKWGMKINERMTGGEPAKVDAKELYQKQIGDLNRRRNERAGKMAVTKKANPEIGRQVMKDSAASSKCRVSFYSVKYF